jgi:hypothetical protein
MRRSVMHRIVLAAVVALAATPAVEASAATSPTSRACPPVSVVVSTLGQTVGAPVATKTAYSKTCTYPGKTRLSSITITFQEDSAAQFAVDEKAVGKSAIKVHGLGQAAWTTGSGDLYVFDGNEQIKIGALVLGVLSPSTATAKVEALARKLL